MTNAEIIATIRAEIERRLANYHPEFVNHGLASGFREDGKAIAYEELLSFLSDLEKSFPAKVSDGEVLEEEMDKFFETMFVLEHENIFEETFKNIARHFYELGCRNTAEKYDEIEYNRQRASGSSEIPKDAKAAAEHFYPQDAFDTQSARELGIACFVDGAKWQADHAPLPEDTALFNKGVEEGKRLMMEEAVVFVAEPETPIGNILMPFIRIDHSVLFRYGIKVGDKVRVIIIKKEEEK